jgi:hypothetical protein
MQKFQKRRLRDGTTSIKDNNVSYLQRFQVALCAAHGGASSIFFFTKGKRLLWMEGRAGRKYTVTNRIENVKYLERRATSLTTHMSITYDTHVNERITVRT